MRDSKSDYFFKCLVRELKVRLKTVHRDRVLASQNNFISVFKSSPEILKFKYVVYKDVLKNFCEGSLFRIILENFIKIKECGKVTETEYQGSQVRIRDLVFVLPKTTPKIMKFLLVSR